MSGCIQLHVNACVRVGQGAVSRGGDCHSGTSCAEMQVAPLPEIGPPGLTALNIRHHRLPE
jgi:hypothetical protein